MVCPGGEVKEELPPVMELSVDCIGEGGGLVHCGGKGMLQVNEQPFFSSHSMDDAAEDSM